MSYNIVCIDDDPNFLLSTKALLGRRYKNVRTATNVAGSLQLIAQNDVDLVLLDISLGEKENGIEALKKIKQASPDTDVVMVTGAKDPRFVVEAIRSGATDYYCKTYEPDELLAIIERNRSAKEVRDRHNALLEGMNPADTRFRLLGSSPVFREMIGMAGRLKGHHEANVLILGESGTGKELLARYIHSLEDNSRRPFIAVNCAAIPEGLIESELFGHERGAFTGAHHRKIGKFELANGGDIFLDEISSLRPDLQAKILRVLQEREIVRVGGNATIPVNFRVISATNDNLTDLVEKSVFRIDLYHRLRVVGIQMPPLRERKEDISLLIAYFLDKFGRPKGQRKISATALHQLQEYSWPGNVRELENVIHSLIILSPDEIITETQLPDWIKTAPAITVADSGSSTEKTGAALTLPDELSADKFKEFMKKAEGLYLLHALAKHGGDKTKTAEVLKIGRTTLYGKLREFRNV